MIIGVGGYESTAVPKLRYPVADADAIYQTLIASGGFKKENILLLTDKTERKPTLRNIKWALGTFLARSAHKDDLVVIYFAGHGASEVDQRGVERDGLSKYLVPSDADPDDLYSSALPMDEMQNVLSRIEAERITVFLDACYSGAAGGRTFASTKTRAVNVDDIFLERLTRSKGRAIVTASRPSEVSVELPELGHGLFTYYLVRGLQGYADLNRDGIVSLQELYEYLDPGSQPEIAGGGRQPAPHDEGRARRCAAADEGRQAQLTVRHTLAALAVLLAATTASAQTSPDGQSWETPMSAGDRAYQLGRYAEAERFFTTALERAERAGGAQDPRVALSLGLLASAYQAGGSYGKAEPLLGRALGIAESALGPDHPEVAVTLTALGSLGTAQGRYAQAEPLLRRALAIDERVARPGASRGRRDAPACWPRSSAGRAATSTRRCGAVAPSRSARRCWGPTTWTWRRASRASPRSTARRAATSRRSSSPSARSPSARSASGPSTPT